jgi:hypothetical protein
MHPLASNISWYHPLLQLASLHASSACPIVPCPLGSCNLFEEMASSTAPMHPSTA